MNFQAMRDPGPCQPLGSRRVAPHPIRRQTRCSIGWRWPVCRGKGSPADRELLNRWVAELRRRREEGRGGQEG